MAPEHPDEERPLTLSQHALSPRGGRAGRRRRVSPATKAVRVACGALSAIVLMASGYGNALINRVNANSGTLSSTDGEGNKDRNPGRAADQNFIVVGNDSRKGYTQEQLDQLSTTEEESLATDTIMLIHVPANGAEISVVSFPRDSYVDIPGFKKNKINAAYVNGYYSAPNASTDDQRRAAGQQTLIATVSQLSGMKIDHFVEVTMLGFYDLTNALGGIEVNLCKASKDPTGNSGADFPAGKQVLKGTEALSFVRQRYGLPEVDLDRIKRQQYFFGAVIRKVLGQGLLDLANVGKLTSIIDALSGTIRYDQALNPLQLADQMSSIAAGKVQFQTIPLAADKFATIDGKDVVKLADKATLDAFFVGLSGGKKAESSPSTSTQAPPTVAPSTVVLDIYNGSGISGAAAKASESLKAQGFTVQATGTASSTDYPASVVEYPPGSAAEANTVAAAVPGSSVKESADVSRVTLIVGNNYPGLDVPSSSASSTSTAPPVTAADDTCIN